MWQVHANWKPFEVSIVAWTLPGIFSRSTHNMSQQSVAISAIIISEGRNKHQQFLMLGKYPVTLFLMFKKIGLPQNLLIKFENHLVMLDPDQCHGTLLRDNSQKVMEYVHTLWKEHNCVFFSDPIVPGGALSSFMHLSLGKAGPFTLKKTYPC